MRFLFVGVLLESMIVIFDEGISYLHCLGVLELFLFPALLLISFFFVSFLFSGYHFFSLHLLFHLFFFFIQLFPFNRSNSRG